MIKNNIKRILKKKGYSIIKNHPADEFKNIYYSQEGEDILLRRFFKNKKDGFYVDVGAHHPFRFSNTCIFYQLGWRGINIDAMPGSMQLFEDFRPEDTNVEAAISDKKNKLKFFIFKERALNTFEEQIAKKRIEIEKCELQELKELQTYTLEEILEKHLSAEQHIDFLTIDVEGHDLSILKSNNWNKYRPSVVLLEDLGGTIEKALETEAYNFLKERGYLFKSRTDNTVFYIDRMFSTR